MNRSVRDANEVRIGAEIVYGATSIGYVLSVVRDPLSQRIRRLITAYGPGSNRREVAVPMEWVVRRTAARVTLAVGTRSLDDLADQRELGTLHSRAAVSHTNGATV